MSSKQESRTSGVRRVVTGHDVQGRSIIAFDAPSPFTIKTAQGRGPQVTDVWRTTRTPADNVSTEEPCSGDIALAPAAGGTVCRVVQFPPDKDYIATWEPDDTFGAMGDSGKHALDSSSKPRYPGMHRTQSVDYAFILAGEIWAIMDEAETLLKAGDVLVQRGTNHAWRNSSNETATVGFVLVSAEKIG